MNAKFFKCKTCGNMVGMINSSGVPIMCCGAPMDELKANTEDAAQEKHVPAVTVKGNKVTVVVGDVEHPMLEEHFIQWIYLETENGGQRKNLKVGGAPCVEFALAADDKAIAAYAYCNLHGLWKTDI